jgi:ComEC/Rec2-related protein
LNDDLLERVGVAAIVVLFLSPSALFDVGFQLSFLACVGIAMGSGRIFRLLKGDAKWLNRLVEGRQVRVEKESGRRGRTPLGLTALGYRAFARFLSVTVSAQIATAPVLLNTFGYLSGWGLLLNFLFIPLLGSVFSVLLLLSFLSLLFPIGAVSLFLYVPSVVATAVSVVFETVDFSSFLIVGKMSSSAIAVYYLLAILLTDKINLKRRRPVYAVFILLLLLFLLLW